jgi:hypothetical protein
VRAYAWASSRAPTAPSSRTASSPPPSSSIRAERVGHVSWALRAAGLRLALPSDAATRERLEADLRRVRARLN